MKLILTDGRKEPSKHSGIWGFDGPELEGVTRVYVADGTILTVSFRDLAALQVAERATGWLRSGGYDYSIELQADISAGCVATGAGYFAAWGLVE